MYESAAYIKIQGRYDITGEKFNRLFVLGCIRRSKTRQPLWLCLCDCGGSAVTTGNKLRAGHTKSCGCLQKERAAEAQATHGLCGSATYDSWRGMIERCYNPKNKAYKWYGGQGITVCENWLKFDGFLKDMGERPEGKTIDRIDYNGNYSPDNCQWLDSKRQQVNRKSSKILEFAGERLCIADWSRKTGINYETIRGRLLRGWSVGRALS